jgi:hypothetical protein
MGGTKGLMNSEAVAKAFNQWMDDYTQDPSAYERIEETAMAHLNAKLEGQEPTYGDRCAAVLAAYIAKQ